MAEERTQLTEVLMFLEDVAPDLGEVQVRDPREGRERGRSEKGWGRE